MNEIHLTKKDFKLEWFSGQGAGGQHRNKHQNCCRITHLESGITVNGTESRSRVENQRTAFNKLAEQVIKWYRDQGKTDLQISEEVIRNYHAPRNEVLDKESGFKQPYKEVVTAGNLSDMIEARRKAKGNEK
jgi:protein subunit release factor A